MPEKRITPLSESREIDALFADRDREVGEVLEEVARLDARLGLEAALEAEVGEFLGRDRYARGERARERPPQRLSAHQRQDDRRRGGAAASQGTGPPPRSDGSGQ